MLIAWGSPCYKAIDETAQEIIRTNFTGVKTNRYFSLKDHWLYFAKQKGLPDTRLAYIHFWSSVSYLLAEAWILEKTFTEEMHIAFKRVIFPERTQKNYAGMFKIFPLRPGEPEYEAPLAEDEPKPKRTRKKKENPLDELNELLGLDNPPVTF
jgi:hypothetical protein